MDKYYDNMELYFLGKKVVMRAIITLDVQRDREKEIHCSLTFLVFNSVNYFQHKITVIIILTYLELLYYSFITNVN